MARYSSFRQVISMCTGISFFTGTVNGDGGSILESETVARIVPDSLATAPCIVSWNGASLYCAVCPAHWISRLAGTVPVFEAFFRQLRSHRDHRVLSAAHHLNRVRVAIVYP